MMKKITGLLLFLFLTALTYAQSISGIVNRYTAVTNLPVCNPCGGNCNTVTVASTVGYAAGDKVLIIQMKGASTDLTNTASFGQVSNYAEAGNYEFKIIQSIAGSDITFTTGLSNTYNAAGFVQLVRVPVYANPTITAPLIAQAWNGTTGGILAIEVTGTLTLSANIDVSGLGFRGGISVTDGSAYPCGLTDYYYSGINYDNAAPKGEGISEIITGYDLGKGAYANGGGGGNSHNGGGGGGSNGGVGGVGGYDFCSGTVLSGGIGGYALNTNSGAKAFLGGGGGAGHQNNDVGTSGGNGGGLIFIKANQIIGNGFTINASGIAALNTTGSGNDGAGGGGAGGTIKIETSSITTALSIFANGGKGGDMIYTGGGHAPGGGAGGGVICTSLASIPALVTTQVKGGIGGIIIADATNFGTTAGTNGTVYTSCLAIPPTGPKTITANLGSDVVLCNPISTNLNAGLSAPWYTYKWYLDDVLLPAQTGSTITAAAPGEYKVIVSSAGCLDGADSVNITTKAAIPNNVQFCAPPAQTVNLSVTGTGQYKWWDAATAGLELAKGPAYAPTLSGTKTFYVEDTATFSYGDFTPKSLLTPFNNRGGGSNTYMAFNAFTNFTIDSITLNIRTYNTNTDNMVINLRQKGNPAILATKGLLVTGPCNCQMDYAVQFYLGFVVPPGNDYYLEYATGSVNVHWDQSGAAYPYSVPDIITITGPVDGSGNTIGWAPTSYGFFYNWKISAGILCSRVPVTATLFCPPATCAKPTSVSAILGTGINDTLCVGNILLIQKDIIDTATTSLNGFYFSWRKVNSSGSTIIQGPSKTYSDLSIASVALADSGHYYLVVQDGLVASPICKDSGLVVVKINQAPTSKGLIASHQEICLTEIAAQLIESKAPTGFVFNPVYHQWYTTPDTTGTPALTKIIGASTATTYSPGAPTLTQYYVRKDSVKFCPAIITNFLKIRVNNSVVTDSILPLENDTLCVSAGSLFQLKGVVDSSANASINNGYYFTWMKLQQPAMVPVVVGTPGVYVDYPPTSRIVTEADSGTYYLIIRDGADATVCQDTLKTKVVVYATCTIIPPICQKPITVTTKLVGTNDTLCVGNSFRLAKDIIDTLAMPLEGYYFSWRRINSLGNTLLYGPSLVYSDLTISSIEQADSGRYYLVVQDGIASDPLCKDSSAVISIVINTPTAIPVILSSDTICPNTIPNLFMGTLGTGMPSATQYQWYISTDSFKTVPASQVIVGAIMDSYQSGILFTTSYYIRRDSVAACPAVESNIITIHVDPPIIPGKIGNDTIVCSGSPVPVFREISAASGGTGIFTYQWQVSGDNNTFTDILGATNNIYQATVIVSNTYFRRIDLSGVCSNITDTISIVVKAPITFVPEIAASDTICQGSIPDLLAATASGVPDYYQWYISTDSFKTASASQLILGAIAGSYQSGALSATSYFLRKDSIVGCPAINSNIITILVDQLVIPGVVGNDTVVCSGSPIYEFNEKTEASGGTTIFNYQWQSSNNNTVFTDISGATNATYQSPDIISRTYFRRIDSSGVCASALTNTIFVDAVTGVNPGLISGTSPTICYNTIPTVSFTNITGASNGSGGAGSESYQWQISTDNVYWTDISGAIALSYTETNQLTDTTYYRRKVGMGPGTCDTSYTASIAVNVYNPFVIGSIPIDLTVCVGKSVTINELTPTSGGDDPNTPPIYEWIESIDKGFTWTTSPGISNLVNYVTPILTDSIWYRRVVTVICNKDTSNIMKINVDSINTVGITMLDVSTCVGVDAVFAPTYFGAGMSPVFKWYSATSSSGPWLELSGVVGSSYTVIDPQLIDDGTFYKVELNSSFTCNSGSDESIVELIVNDVIEPKVSVTSNPSGAICDTTLSITYTANPIQGAGSGATYQWYNGVTNIAISSETNVTYIPTAPPLNGDQVYVVMTSDIACAIPTTAKSDKIVLDVRTKPSPIIQNRDTIVCTPQEVILKASGITSGSNHFQWYRNGILIPDADKIAYTATSNDFPGGKYTFVEDNGACGTVSDTVKILMLKSPSAYAGADITAVEGETISLNGLVSNNTTYFVWVPTSGLSDPYILRPSLIVPSLTTVYTLVAYNNSNVCSSSDAVIIQVEKRIRIPNVITINGDGINDTWEIENIENFPDVEFLIYNRWGNIVWKSNGYSKLWDGTNYRNGEVLPDGTYFYIIDLHSIKVKDSYTGWVQIVR